MYIYIYIINDKVASQDSSLSWPIFQGSGAPVAPVGAEARLKSCSSYGKRQKRRQTLRNHFLLVFWFFVFFFLFFFSSFSSFFSCVFIFFFLSSCLYLFFFLSFSSSSSLLLSCEKFSETAAWTPELQDFDRFSGRPLGDPWLLASGEPLQNPRECGLLHGPQ